jgi:hypothetical protein
VVPAFEAVAAAALRKDQQAGQAFFEGWVQVATSRMKSCRARVRTVRAKAVERRLLSLPLERWDRFS